MPHIFKSILICTLGFFFAACTDLQLTENQVQQAEYDRYQAVISKDTTALKLLLAEEFTYSQPDGAVTDRQTYADNVAAGRPSITHADIDSISVRIYGITAVSTGIVTIDAEMAGEAITASLRFTNTWVWRDNRLQLAARHSSFID